MVSNDCILLNERGILYVEGGVPDEAEDPALFLPLERLVDRDAAEPPEPARRLEPGTFSATGMEGSVRLPDPLDCVVETEGDESLRARVVGRTAFLLGGDSKGFTVDVE